MTQKSRLPWESMKYFQSHSKWCSAKKKICFLNNFYDLSVPKLVFEIQTVSLPFLFDISVAFVSFPFGIPGVFVDNPTLFVDIPAVFVDIPAVSLHFSLAFV